MRKMVHVIHAVWTRGTPFVPETTRKNAISKAELREPEEPGHHFPSDQFTGFHELPSRERSVGVGGGGL